jgi:ATP-dependent RNA helicase HelY
MTCSRGDIAQYVTLRRKLSDVEGETARRRRADQAAAAESLRATWRVGDVLAVPAGRSRGLVVVLSTATDDPDGPAPVVLTESRQVRRLAASDLRQTPTRVASIQVPRGFDRKAATARRALVSAMRAAARAEASAGPPQRSATAQGEQEPVQTLRAELRAHPCHACPDREEHLRWAQRRWQAERDLQRLEEGLARRRGSIAADFDRVCGVLDTLGYLDGDGVTPAGDQLRGLFGELDLLAAECLRIGLWEGLHPADLAACAAALTFQSRGSDSGTVAHLAAGEVRGVLEDMVRTWQDLHTLERTHRLEYLRPPDLGFCAGAQRWAAGHSLAAVLAEQDMTPGDFVRAVRQVLDVLDQLASVAGSASVRDSARRAMTAINRGVVAYDTLG